MHQFNVHQTIHVHHLHRIGTMQVLRNAVGVGVSAFPEKALRRWACSRLLALRGGG